MAELRALPSRLDLVRPPGDDFAVQVTVTSDGTPVNISGWTLAGDGCDVAVSDGPAGVFTVTPTAEPVGSRRWTVRRTAPDVRTVLSGSDRVSEQADRTAGPVTAELQLVDGTPVSLEISRIGDDYIILASVIGGLTPETLESEDTLIGGNGPGDL